MSTEYRRKIQFRGPSILDDELARPVGSAANGKASKVAAPASSSAPAPPGGGAVTSPPTKSPTRAGSRQADLRPAAEEACTGAGPGAREPATDPRQAYLEAIAALVDARMALTDGLLRLERLRSDADAAGEVVRQAVEALGCDPLGVLGRRLSPAAGQRRRDPEAFLEEVLALLPARPSQIAVALGVKNRSNVARLLARAEARGLVRKEPDAAARPGVGRPGFVWHRVDGGGPA